MSLTYNAIIFQKVFFVFYFIFCFQSVLFEIKSLKGTLYKPKNRLLFGKLYKLKF